MIWKLLVGAIAWALMASAPSNASASGSCSVAGRYFVSGNTPGGSGYRGEAVISPSVGGCYVEWLAPNTSSGTGYFANGELTINFAMGGRAGVVRYWRQPSGELKGQWWMNATPNAIGTETLIPNAKQSYAPNSSASAGAAAQPARSFSNDQYRGLVSSCALYAAAKKDKDIMTMFLMQRACCQSQAAKDYPEVSSTQC